jgi:hypothetical protein
VAILEKHPVAFCHGASHQATGVDLLTLTHRDSAAPCEEENTVNDTVWALSGCKPVMVRMAALVYEAVAGK